MEIKALAKKGQMPAARVMAKDLVRTRNAISKFYQVLEDWFFFGQRVRLHSLTLDLR